jgi:hypothetical protein
LFDDLTALLQRNRLFKEFPQTPGKAPVHLYLTVYRHFALLALFVPKLCYYNSRRGEPQEVIGVMYIILAKLYKL